MAPTHTEPPQQHSPSNVLLALRRLPFPKARHPPPPPPPGRSSPLARPLEELAAAVGSHLFLKPFLSFHAHLTAFSQSRRRVAMQPSGPLSGQHCFAAVLGDSVAGLVVANGINNFLNLYNTVLVVRLVLTWFPNTPPAIVAPLSTICDPYLNIFRGIIPPLGGTLDLSPILAFLVLNVFSSTAAALPAELPNSAASQHPSTSTVPSSTNQSKWMRRIRSAKSQEEDGSH